jgi:hypothetical protein
MPLDTCSEKPPFSRCGTPHANSTFSRPRAISPAASPRTLPCSAVMIAASSSLRSCNKARNANRMSARLLSELDRQVRAASAATTTAASTSDRLARSTCAATAPVAGL